MSKTDPVEKARTLPFVDRPCRCVVNHTPVPLRIELHHIMPQSDQRRIWGKVNDLRLEPLCDTSHANVHAYLDWLLGKRDTKPLVNAFIRELAERGFKRIRAAELAITEKDL